MNEQETKKFLADNQYKFALNFPIQSNAINSEKKTIEVVLSDETPVYRYNWEVGEFDLILVHDINSVDLERADIMPLLVQHDDGMLPIGVWENLRIEERKLKGTARFDTEDELAMKIFGKFERGIMKSFSIGVDSWTLELFKSGDNNSLPLYRATNWSIRECSVVTIPANLNAKVGFSNQSKENNTENDTNEKDLCYNSSVNNLSKEQKKMTKEEFKASHPDLYAQIFSDGEKNEKERVLAHIEMSKTTGATQYSLECIEKGEGFGANIQAKYLGFAMNKNDANDRNNENIPPVETPQVGENVEEKNRDSKFASYFGRDDLKDGGK